MMTQETTTKTEKANPNKAKAGKKDVPLEPLNGLSQWLFHGVNRWGTATYLLGHWNRLERPVG